MTLIVGSRTLWVEALGRIDDSLLGRGAVVVQEAADCRFPGAGASRVGERDVVVEDDPELDDPEQDRHQDRQDEGELDDRLARLIPVTACVS